MKNNSAIVVHGGAGPDSDFIRGHEAQYLAAIKQAADTGYAIVDNGGKGVSAPVALNESDVRPVRDGAARDGEGRDPAVRRDDGGAGAEAVSATPERRRPMIGRVVVHWIVVAELGVAGVGISDEGRVERVEDASRHQSSMGDKK